MRQFVNHYMFEFLTLRAVSISVYMYINSRGSWGEGSPGLEFWHSSAGFL